MTRISLMDKFLDKKLRYLYPFCTVTVSMLVLKGVKLYSWFDGNARKKNLQSLKRICSCAQYCTQLWLIHRVLSVATIYKIYHTDL